VTRLFQRKGQIVVPRENNQEDQLMEVALEAGAEDFQSYPQVFEILTDPSSFEKVQKAVEDKGYSCEVAEITSLPTLTVSISDSAAIQAINKLVENLEDHMDVKDVYTNAEFPDETGGESGEEAVDSAGTSA
jgi:transcriptional/translational regulatory protein YebC/TACO1